MKRILVTGGRSFTAHYLSGCLRRANYDVHLLVRDAPRAAWELQADLRNETSLAQAVGVAKPDAVVHLAGVSHVQHADTLAFYDVNVLGTLRLLQAVADLRTGSCRVLLASSGYVYGHGEPGRPSTEKVCPAPVNHYAASKLAMEQMARASFPELQITSVRPFNYTGRGQSTRFVVAKIVRHLLDGAAEIELGDMTPERDFLDVRDVCSAYRLLLESAEAPPVVNICSGRGWRLRQVLELAQEVAGRRLVTRANQEFFRPTEIRSLVGDNETLVQLGWTPAFGLRDTLAWMLGSPGYADDDDGLELCAQ